MNIEQQILRLRTIRENIGDVNISSGDANEIIRRGFNPNIRLPILNSIRQNSDFVTEVLSKQRAVYKKTLGISLSNPSLCAYYIETTTCQSAWDSAEEDLITGETLTAAYRLDYAYGIFITVGSIPLAEEALAVGIDTSAMKFTKYAKETGVTNDSADMYIASSKNKRDAINFLMRDPSGFLLIDEYVKEIRSYAKNLRNGVNSKSVLTRIQPYQVPEFVVAGAELGRDIYKLVYPLAQKTSA